MNKHAYICIESYDCYYGFKPFKPNEKVYLETYQLKDLHNVAYLRILDFNGTLIGTIHRSDLFKHFVKE